VKKRFKLPQQPKLSLFLPHYKKKKIEPKNNILEDKPEVIFKYPLDIKDKFDLEDLAYSCFSTGIEAESLDKACNNNIDSKKDEDYDNTFI
jgi:hypothetical protein